MPKPESVAVAFAHDCPLNGPLNMARDVDLLDGAESGVAGCRVYAWDGPWVSLGRFQRPEDALLTPTSAAEHEKLVEGFGSSQFVPWVIRPTGGKAVLHGHDVTIGLAVPLSVLNLEGPRVSIKAAYTQITQPLIAALRGCGLPAALAVETKFAERGPRVADCFAHISPNDIVDERTGVKVCGCALRLTQRAILVQASIPVGRPLVEPESIIRGAAKVPIASWDHLSFVEQLKKSLSEV